MINKTRSILGILLAAFLAAIPALAGDDDGGFGRLLKLAKEAKESPRRVRRLFFPRVSSA